MVDMAQFCNDGSHADIFLIQLFDHRFCFVHHGLHLIQLCLSFGDLRHDVCVADILDVQQFVGILFFLLREVCFALFIIGC